MREEHISVEDRIRRASAGWTRVLACAFEQKGDFAARRPGANRNDLWARRVETACAEGICCVWRIRPCRVKRSNGISGSTRQPRSLTCVS